MGGIDGWIWGIARRVFLVTNTNTNNTQQQHMNESRTRTERRWLFSLSLSRTCTLVSRLDGWVCLFLYLSYEGGEEGVFSSTTGMGHGLAKLSWLSWADRGERRRCNEGRGWDVCSRAANWTAYIKLHMCSLSLSLSLCMTLLRRN